jgi:enamine deaminase RidA (YjgF/YER057c/UK114 family)
MSAEERIRELGLNLEAAAGPLANYVPVVRSGNLLFLSGHLPPAGADGARPAGKLGADLSVEQGYAAARQAAVALLTTVRRETGSLDKVRRIVKVLALVNSAPDFVQQPQVVNGASDLLVEVFGETIGRHARSAVGAVSLPLNAPVEIEMVVEVEG